MTALPSPRRMQSVPRGRQLLYKEGQRDVSQRTVCETRAWNSDRDRFVPLAAPRPVDTTKSRLGMTPQEPGARASPGEPPGVQEGRPMPVLPPVCCGLDAHAAHLTACLRRVSDPGQITPALRDCGTSYSELVALRPW